MKANQNRKASRNALRQGFVTALTALSLALGTLTPATAHAATAHAATADGEAPFTQALADAHAIADMNTGWNVFVSHGESMIPQIAHGTLLIAAQADFNQLAAGMLVIYRDAAGDLVSHRIIERTESGWIAKGLNNDRADPGLVTRANFQGVVFGTVSYQAGTENLVALGSKAPSIAYAKKY